MSNKRAILLRQLVFVLLACALAAGVLYGLWCCPEPLGGQTASLPGPIPRDEFLVLFFLLPAYFAGLLCAGRLPVRLHYLGALFLVGACLGLAIPCSQNERAFELQGPAIAFLVTAQALAYATFSLANKPGGPAATGRFRQRLGVFLHRWLPWVWGAMGLMFLAACLAALGSRPLFGPEQAGPVFWAMTFALQAFPGGLAVALVVLKEESIIGIGLGLGLPCAAWLILLWPLSPAALGITLWLLVYLIGAVRLLLMLWRAAPLRALPD